MNGSRLPVALIGGAALLGVGLAVVVFRTPAPPPEVPTVAPAAAPSDAVDRSPDATALRPAAAPEGGDDAAPAAPPAQREGRDPDDPERHAHQDEIDRLAARGMARHGELDVARWMDVGARLEDAGQDALAADVAALAARVGRATEPLVEREKLDILDAERRLILQLLQTETVASDPDAVATLQALEQTVQTLQQGGAHPADIDPMTGQPTAPGGR